jgi:hypothetical protein
MVAGGSSEGFDSIRLSEDDLLNWRTAIEAMRNAYLAIDRKSIETEYWYEAQFLLRFVNIKLKRTLAEFELKDKISDNDRETLEYISQILSHKNQNFYRSPQKAIPIYGVQGSDWPLSRWEDDPEFYNYEYDNDGNLLYRGLKLKSGDVLLNHPIEKPVGIFTAINEKQSVFAHAAMIVILNRKHGKLPVVVDVHERGVRAVPLSHFLSSQVISYAEVFSFTNASEDFNIQLDESITQLLKENHPYDLSGSNDRAALSCTELISYILELTHQAPLEMKNKIKNPIYVNILRLGKIEQQYLQVPNDVFQDSRFILKGYIDNPLSFNELLINEVLLDLFKEQMAEGIIKSSKSLSRFFGEIAIDQIHNHKSFLGGFILGLTGFNRENFPVGDRGLLSAVNAIDNTFYNAEEKCLEKKDKFFKKENNCFKFLAEHQNLGNEISAFSIFNLKNNIELRATVRKELKKFYTMFD